MLSVIYYSTTCYILQCYPLYTTATCYRLQCYLLYTTVLPVIYYSATSYILQCIPVIYYSATCYILQCYPLYTTVLPVIDYSATCYILQCYLLYTTVLPVIYYGAIIIYHDFLPLYQWGVVMSSQIMHTHLSTIHQVYNYPPSTYAPGLSTPSYLLRIVAQPPPSSLCCPRPSSRHPSNLI